MRGRAVSHRSGASPPPAPHPSHLRPPAGRSSATRSLVAVLLLGLAVAAWAGIGRHWRRERPLRRHLSAGIRYVEQGMGPQAEAEWKEALRLDPSYAPAYQLLAEYYLSAHAWSKTRAALERLRALSPDEEHLDCRLAACYLNLGDEVSAFRLAEAEARRDPDCVPALATSAILLSRMGEKSRALGYLRRLGRLEPNDPVLQYMLAETLSDTFQYREARPVLERVLSLEPAHAEAYTLLGAGWIDDAAAPDHLDRAQKALLKSLELNPLDPEARLALGRLYLRRNQPQKAVLQLEEAARLMPHNSRPPFELARAFDQLRQAPRAAAARRRFLQLRQLSSLVGALEKRGAVEPTAFEYPYRLGRIELQRGNYRRAYIWLQKAQALRPNDRRVGAALEELSRRTGISSRMGALQERIAAPAEASRSPASGRP
jgi:tetratricopeptide (TPR) repeat protein